MPRPTLEKTIPDTMTLTLRLQRYVDLSKKLTPVRKKRIKEHLGAVMQELQEVNSSGK